LVITDQNTYKNLKGERSVIFDYAEVKSIDVDNLYNQKEKSRYLKTTLIKYVESDFLFVDCDTVICCDFSDNVFEGDIAMVLDRNCLMSERDDRGKSIKLMAKKCGFGLDKCENYFNSGVMWVRNNKNSERFFEEWHNYWKETLKIGMCVDQLSLNYVNSNIDNVVLQLSGEWNCQTSLQPAGVSYIADAKIMHYFNTNENSPFKLCDEKIIKAGFNSAIVDEIISNPRKSFKMCYFVTSNSEYDKLLKSYQFKILRMLYLKAKWWFWVVERFFGILVKMWRKIKKEKNWKRY
jgi:hypothetical protein